MGPVRLGLATEGEVNGESERRDCASTRTLPNLVDRTQSDFHIDWLRRYSNSHV